MVERRKRAIIAHHSKLAVRPQALARGFLLRCKWKKSVIFANRYARAVLTIQRAIRRSGAMAVAVAEIMARKRDSNNPFNKCSSIHKVRDCHSHSNLAKLLPLLLMLMSILTSSISAFLLLSIHILLAFHLLLLPSLSHYTLS